MHREHSRDLRGVVSQLVCFSLLFQTTGVAAALPLTPTKTFLTASELTARPNSDLPSSDRPGLGAELLEHAWGSLSEGSEAVESWWRGATSRAWSSESEEPYQIAQLGGPWPLPPRLMATLLSVPAGAQSAPPSPGSLEDVQQAMVSESELALLAEKVGTEDIPLLPGYNLISLPEQPADTDPAVVLAALGGQLHRVEAYDACDLADPQKLYDPADPAASDLTVIDHRKGLWVAPTVATVLPSDGTLPATTSLDLCVGWNLIGFPAGEARHPLTVLSSIAGKWDRIFGYDAFDPADPWEGFDPAVPDWANNLPLMQPGRGYWLLVTEATTLTIRNQGSPPVVAISTPTDLAVVTEPTEIVGTVDSGRLASWSLSCRAIGEGEAVTLATGNAPVSGASLGTFDPTLLLNGLYELELTATDVQGQQVTESIAVAIEGQMKIGHFTLEFLDLDLPVSGLDLELIRRYDSRDKRLGELGVGWALEIRQGSVQHNRTPGEGWQIVGGFLPCEAAVETASHLTVVRLSELEVYRFTPEITSLASTGGGCFAEIGYRLFDGPVAGATLEILGNTDVFYENGGDRLLDVDTLEPYVPDRVRLKTRDGRLFELTVESGVQRIEDHNGNSLVFQGTSIAHSSGKSITMERDAAGRITKITDSNAEEIVYSYDSRGDLTAVADPMGHTTRFAYDDEHRVLEIEDPLGNRAVRNDYDAEGRLIRTTDALGQPIEFTHDLNGRREVIRNRLGEVRILAYDDRGNVVREIDERGSVTTRIFDARDNQTSETSPLGQVVSYTHDASDNLVEVTDPLGHKTIYTYNDSGQVVTRQDPNGGTQTNTYNSLGVLLTSEDSLGATFAFEYGAPGDLSKLTDSRGCVTDLISNSDGLVASIRTAEGTGVTYTYDPNGNRTSEFIDRTLQDGTVETLVTSFTYDALNRLVSTTYPDGSTTATRYNELGLTSALVDELGRETTFEYDAAGRRIRTHFPDATAEEATYDAEGRRISSRDRAGRETQFRYDQTGNWIEKIFPDSSSVTRTYDSAGRLLSETNEIGGVTRFAYDAANNMTEQVDPVGNRTELAYDGNGNAISMTDGNDNTVQFEYDGLNRRTKTLYPDGTSDENTWDALGRLEAATDQNGHQTTFEHDCIGRLKRVQDTLGQVTRYDYDEAGNLIAQIDAEGRVTRFAHDRRGRIVLRELPLGQVETSSYNAVGQLASVEDFNGRQTTYSYDVADRVIGKIHVGVGSVSYTYSPVGNRASISTSEGTWSYTHDDRDRLLGVTQPDGRSLAYTYDAAGNRTSILAPTGTTFYRYDVANRLSEVDSAAGLNSFTYDGAGNRTTILHGNGTSVGFIYDSLERLTEVSHRRNDGTLMATYAYDLDAEGNRLAVTESSGRSVAYAYDDVYRLTSETITDPVQGNKAISYTFDRVGNRLTRTEDGAITSYVYDANDRLLTAGDVAFDYDPSGNLIRRTDLNGVDVYSYDHENRLIRAERGSRSVDLGYDDDGLRIRRTVDDTVTTEFLFDSNRPLPRVLTEFDSEGLVVANYVHASEILSMARDGGVFYFHGDAQGTTRQLSDATETVVSEYGFDAFGNPLFETGEIDNEYLYVGEPRDPALGLDYFRARYYDPSQGRFLSTDPVAGDRSQPSTLHDYLYAGHDPVNKRDPSGLFTSLTEFSFASAVQTTVRGIQSTRAIRILRRGFTGKKWDAFMVGERMPRPLFGGLIKNHYFMYLNKRKGNRGLRFDIGVSRGRVPKSFNAVVPGFLSIERTRLSSVSRGASRGPWRVGAFNRKQRGIWLMLTIPPGFTDAAARPIQYSFSSPLKILGNPLKGDLWEKLTVNCYTWTAYAAGTAVIVSFIPIR